MRTRSVARSAAQSEPWTDGADAFQRTAGPKACRAFAALSCTRRRDCCHRCHLIHALALAEQPSKPSLVPPSSHPFLSEQAASLRERGHGILPHEPLGLPIVPICTRLWSDAPEAKWEPKTLHTHVKLFERLFVQVGLRARGGGGSRWMRSTRRKGICGKKRRIGKGRDRRGLDGFGPKQLTV